MDRLVTTTHFEMTNRAQLRQAVRSRVTYQLVRAEIPCPELNRFLYTAVGVDWWWYSRLSWNRARWLAYVDRADLETWVAYVSGTPAGYFELERQSEGNVEIAYFGLLPQFIGKGFGSQLLADAVTRAWEMGATRVWVHTCDLDHPQALANYKARGFTVFHVESKVEQLPDHPLEVWPGASVR
jgi:GNAT superfamily N-acetyltransferase